jgi:hypothetical protein
MTVTLQAALSFFVTKYPETGPTLPGRQQVRHALNSMKEGASDEVKDAIKVLLEQGVNKNHSLFQQAWKTAFEAAHPTPGEGATSKNHPSQLQASYAKKTNPEADALDSGWDLPEPAQAAPKAEPEPAQAAPKAEPAPVVAPFDDIEMVLPEIAAPTRAPLDDIKMMLPSKAALAPRPKAAAAPKADEGGAAPAPKKPGTDFTRLYPAPKTPAPAAPAPTPAPASASASTPAAVARPAVPRPRGPYDFEALDGSTDKLRTALAAILGNQGPDELDVKLVELNGNFRALADSAYSTLAGGERLSKGSAKELLEAFNQLRGHFEALRKGAGIEPRKTFAVLDAFNQTEQVLHRLRRDSLA